MSGLILGIGINNSEYPTWCDGKVTKEYASWHCMIGRCTKKFLETNPSYVGCSVSEAFKNYSLFYEWCQSQAGFDSIDQNGKRWHLDKDLLLKNNKTYSAEACVFIPQRINSLLTKRKALRGDFPVGVHFHKNRKMFIAKCKDGEGNQKHLGCFNTPENAFKAYKVFKEQLIKDVANEYREQLDIRAYQALMQYEVNIDD